jgi:hypothetical protein
MSFFNQEAIDLFSRTFNSAGGTIPALKEWAVVCKALETGRQTILFRKGGIMEYRQGFEVKHHNFFLYPTFEHQSRDHLQQDYLDELDIVLRNAPMNNRNTITTFAKAVEVRETTDEVKLRRLRRYHIWNDNYVNIRLKYNSKRAMSVIILRVYRMSQPLEIEARSEFAGCKSWIPIPIRYLKGELSIEQEKLQHNRTVQLDSLIEHSEPVLGNSEFSDIVAYIQEVMD